MTKHVLGLALVAVLLTLAPLAAADADSGNTTSSERPGNAAWVEDCPPDMMCAFSDTPKDDDNTTRGPEDCEFCRYGPDDCIDCSGMPVPADDNTTWGTDCPPGVYCMYDGAPSDGEEADGTDTSSSDVTGEAPALGGLLFAGAVGLVLVAFVAGRRA